MAAMQDALIGLLRRRLTPPAMDWLEKQAEAPSAAAFAAARRKVGFARFDLTPAERLELGVDLVGWGVDDGARAVLLRAADPAWALATWRRAELRERRAILRALPLLRPAAAYLELALEGCRSSIVPVFEAIACDNCYPAMHFSDRAFAQLALKAAVYGLDLGRVVGLEQRGGQDLRRLAAAAAQERRAAGRTVPLELAALAGEEAAP